ncbi:MAG: hypothetical protein ACREB8_01090 [Pseudolabrys sp.]
MTHPIPTAALDDRFGFVGNAGGGKTYSSGTAVERLLNSKARVVIPDPLGVWYGLALDADGKTPSMFRKSEELVIFGGPRGDLPLNEYAGALIGETVAGMKESCILDLSELGTKAAERRFMLAFLTALYKHKTNEPLHVIFDEADMWAPQRILDKEGEAMKLLGMMETVVRRGRAKGFIPWLITQRPAVLSKNVLSQVDGLVAFKLTSVQDRDAIGDWVEGQADKAQWKDMWGNMATLARGEGVVWIPARGILKTTQFPQKITFDSSRAPKRGETLTSAAALEPVNLDKLKDKLSKVEAETKANDPRVLKAEIAKLKTELAKKPATVSGPATERIIIQSDLKEIRAAHRAGFDAGFGNGVVTGANTALDLFGARLRDFGSAAQQAVTRLEELRDGPKKPSGYNEYEFKPSGPAGASTSPAAPIRAAAIPSARRVPSSPAPGGDDTLSGPIQRILASLSFWSSIGQGSPSRSQVAFVAGYSPRSSGYEKALSTAKTAGLVVYPSGGSVAMTDDGYARADSMSADGAKRAILSVLTNPQRTVTDTLISIRHSVSRDRLAAETGYSDRSSGYEKVLSQLNTLDIAFYPSPGHVQITDWAAGLLS